MTYYLPISSPCPQSSSRAPLGSTLFPYSNSRAQGRKTNPRGAVPGDFLPWSASVYCGLTPASGANSTIEL
eukprot:scaffold31410_cov72-Skeletonema_dohrnii-CCMP3373.AAC.1